ncbi:MAG: cupin domain-containing protein [Oscillospiraceae bacterium]|jgi:transcriptional regulator with XRE-family HTH domain|nr:cupin domain-containing protein [Oscillospiraceae bacterium]
MDTQIIEIARRIKGLRDDCGFSAEEMAESTGVSVEEYREYERGALDFPYSFLHRCASRFGVDVVELLTGESPHLMGYEVTRSGQGLQMSRREGFRYFHLAPLFRKKLAEPFRVIAPYSAEDQGKPVELNSHAGQEINIVLSGKLKFVFERHEEILEPGDSVYYDSGRKHGMIAIGGTDCAFLAFVLKPGN